MKCLNDECSLTRKDTIVHNKIYTPTNNNNNTSCISQNPERQQPHHRWIWSPPGWPTSSVSARGANRRRTDHLSSTWWVYVKALDYPLDRKPVPSGSRRSRKRPKSLTRTALPSRSCISVHWAVSCPSVTPRGSRASSIGTWSDESIANFTARYCPRN